jgi:hypothetical protein
METEKKRQVVTELADSAVRMDIARDAFVQAYRSEISTHATFRHQILVLSGALIGAAASTTPESGLVLLALSVVSAGLALSMLYHDRIIVGIITYIAGLGDHHAREQASYELSLATSRNHSVIEVLMACASYVVPVGGSTAATVAFVETSSPDILVLIPSSLLAVLAVAGANTLRSYRILERDVRKWLSSEDQGVAQDGRE